MAVYKNKSNNTWYVSVYYKNWQGSIHRMDIEKYF